MALKVEIGPGSYLYLARHMFAGVGRSKREGLILDIFLQSSLRKYRPL